ncbi:MAG: hypothetical protein ACYDC1_20040 [Limisphaerales bacterium]
MGDPVPTINGLQKYLGALVVSFDDANSAYAEIQSQLAMLQTAGIEPRKLEVVDRCVKIMLHLEPGDEHSAFMFAISELDRWRNLHTASDERSKV